MAYEAPLGLFLLLFAWPLNRVLRTTHDQITQLDWNDYFANRAARR